MGGAPSVSAPPKPDAALEYQQALQAYTQNAPALYGEESQYQPLYNQLQQGIMGSNIPFYAQALENQMPGAQTAINQSQVLASQGALANYGTTGAEAAQYALGNSSQLRSILAYGKGQLGASQDPVLQSLLGQAQGQGAGNMATMTNLANQAGTMFNPVNQQLGNISQQLGQETGAGTQSLTNLANQAAANQRSDIFNQTASTVMGNLGKLDPVTQQLSDTAQQQLTLGGQLSPQALQDASQAARAAYSARGMLNSSGSIAAEVLNRDQVQQARLQQREQFASGVSGLVQNEQQQRTQNALGLTQTDIAATQANQQMADQFYQAATGLQQSGAQVQGGLQQQIAANLGTSQQLQQSASQQAIQNQMANQQLSAGLQGSILDQLYRQQQAGVSAMDQVYGAQQQAMNQVTGAPNMGPSYMGSTAGMLPSYGTGSPNLFQGSGLLSLVNQNNMAYYNATAAANQMNAQSAGAAQGATMGMVGSIGAAAIGGIALL